SNTPATAPIRSCTKPATSGRRRAAPRTGGKTSATRRSFCSWAMSFTTRATTTCDDAWASFKQRDALLGASHPSPARLRIMMQAVPALDSPPAEMQAGASSVLLHTVVIGLTAFLTVVDLFATQAILPSLTRAYRVTPAAMGFAVNASMMGMAVAGLVVSVFSQHIDRRFGILVSLALLSIPTALLAIAPDLTTFTALRIAQGLCMASAFTL